MTDKGWLLVEHGYTQGQAVRDLFTEAGFDGVITRRDYNGLERYSGAVPAIALPVTRCHRVNKPIDATRAAKNRPPQNP